MTMKEEGSFHFFLPKNWHWKHPTLIGIGFQNPKPDWCRASETSVGAGAHILASAAAAATFRAGMDGKMNRSSCEET